jgi:proton-translocating NADH-quinone oxidoreductase chain L
MYLPIVFLPLVGSSLAGLGGRFVGPTGASLITTTCLLLSLFLSCLCFYEVALCGSPCHIHLLDWFDSAAFVGSWGFLFDTLTVTMCIVVTFVSSCVHLFSIDYMSADPHRPRFIAYLSFFTFGMLTLITADNFMQLFFGWEFVGLCSYLLINFWYSRITANRAALKAFIINRVGDFGFGLGVFATFVVFQSIEFETIFACAPLYAHTNFTIFNCEVDQLTCLAVLLFVGAVGKSSQIGLHTWLPDAMEGPTPVSALIHAATMVTAGIYMILRCSPLLEYAPDALSIIAFFGASTAFFAATTGLLQNDLKKVIAYSTCSQLGYMCFAVGLSKYNVSFFHLANHAFFKALLFLSAGCVIHAMADEQEMRRMGGLLSTLPFTYSTITLGSLALMGTPFLSGFYSKDAILEYASIHYFVAGSFTFWLGVLAAFCTAFYSFRLGYLTFLTNTNAYRYCVEHIHDAPLIVIIALCPLVVGSLWSGYLGQDMFLGIGTPFWGNSLFFGWTTTLGLEPHVLPLATKFLPLILTCLGGFLAFLAFVCLSNITFTLTFHPWIKPIFTFLNKKWYFDKIYDEVFLIQTILFGRNVTYRLLDGFIFESLGPVGVQSTVGTLSGSHRNFQNGFLPNYTSFFFFGVWIFLVGFVALPKCLHLFPGLEVFLVTASLGLPALLGVFLWDCTLSGSQS